MPSDPRAQQAREAHRLAGLAAREAERHRGTRNRLVRALRQEDPGQWTYPALAAAVGISVEMVAAIVQGRTGRTGERSHGESNPGLRIESPPS